MHNSSRSIKSFGVNLFLISLVGTAICAISVWILASRISGDLQATLIGLGFAVAIGGLLISLALYFMFTALSEIIYFLSVISENTEKHKSKNIKQRKINNSISGVREQNDGAYCEISEENGEIYYDIKCPNCDASLSFAKWQVDEKSEILCPNCEHELSILKK